MQLSRLKKTHKLSTRMISPIHSSPLLALIIGAVVLSGCEAQQTAAPQAEQQKNFAAAPAATGVPMGDEMEWLGWRGPNRNGVVTNQKPVTTWSETENVIWRTKVPGRGHASPIVVDGQIILATADTTAETQSVVSYDFATGKKNWETVVNTGNFNPRIFQTNTHASSTVTSDGELLFVVFNNNQAAQVAALDLKGDIKWSKQAADFKPKRYQFGFGASPIVYNDMVIVISECEKDGSMVALNTQTGDEVWRVARDAATSYSTPVVAQVAGKDQLILSGANATVAYDPTNGAELWHVAGKWVVTCGTAVWSDDMVFVSGGYPVRQTMAIKADGSEEVAWQNTAKCYEQSMLYFDGHLYGLTDDGVCYCWRGEDGEEMWKVRMEKKVSASPVLANGNIYISVESGKTFVFKANPEKFELVAENQLGDMAYPSPAIVDNKLLLRVAEGAGKDKQEWLYCIGKKD